LTTVRRTWRCSRRHRARAAGLRQRYKDIGDDELLLRYMYGDEKINGPGADGDGATLSVTTRSSTWLRAWRRRSPGTGAHWGTAFR
jgi:oxaloacetate decarboxylase alpha subunit